MKALFVCPFIPWPLDGGGKIRSFHLIANAAKHVELHLRLLREPGQGVEHEEPLRELSAHCEFFDRSPCGPVRRFTRPKIERWFHSDALRRRLDEDARGGGFDVVHLDELLLARKTE